jgi:DUF1680 family protein
MQALNADAILGHCLSWIERVGWAANFDIVAGFDTDAVHAGVEFADSEVYKLLEAMAWELGRRHTPELQEDYRSLASRVVAAQDDDGYLHTAFGHAGQRPRYSDLEWGHELYCFGHLIQAAVARLRTGHEDELVTASHRLVDHIYREFGPTGRAAVCGHPEIEAALVEFYRATQDARALELAALFVERRGRGILSPTRFGPEYFLDDMPVRDAKILRGHAVRALYLAAGALDVAVEADDPALGKAVATQWAATVARRTYLTGGMGAHHKDEAFGADYELPPDRSYAETCAGIASVMLGWRLLLDSGEHAYADLMERTLLNTVVTSPRADGRAFFYSNVLHQRVTDAAPNEDAVTVGTLTSLRAPWFEYSCCPTNVARMLASVALYFATKDDRGVQLHQYGSYEIATDVLGAPLAVRVESGYPYDGDVVVTVLSDRSDPVELSMRIPTWAVAKASVEETSGRAVVEGRTVRVTGPFSAGDRIVLHIPMPARFTAPAPAIDAVRGQVAVERGPLVLAAESVDLPAGTDTEQIVLDMSVPPTTTRTGATVEVLVRADHVLDWPYAPDTPETTTSRQTVPLVPYYTWANRGPSTMRVWIPALGRR